MALITSLDLFGNMVSGQEKKNLNLALWEILRVLWGLVCFVLLYFIKMSIQAAYF